MTDEKSAEATSDDSDVSSPSKAPKAKKSTKKQKRKRRRNAIIAGVLGVLLLATGWLVFSPRAQFVVGGALVNLGYRLQDRLASYDLLHEEDISPQHIWDELQRQNQLSAGVRGLFPRSVRHPVVAIVACMDARIDTNELVGDTRRYYYIVRTAGSVMSPAEQEMLELAVLNGVKVILYTTHTDCAAEGAAANPEQREKFPALIDLMDDREARIKQFYERPVIQKAIEDGELLIKRARIDTEIDKLVLEDASAH
jgi:carbonic anhydrase